MKDRMERLVLLPFSIGCVSESSVAVATPGHAQELQPTRSNTSFPIRRKEEDEESWSSNESMKNSLKFLAISKPNISTGFHRIYKTFKTFSQLFAYKEMEEVKMEMEMEIGLPTDVKHVTHIGWDGLAEDAITTTAVTTINTNPFQEGLVDNFMTNISSDHPNHKLISLDQSTTTVHQPNSSLLKASSL